MARYPKGSTPKLTNKLIEELALLLRRGSYIESAAAACGISKDTLYRWLKNGKRESGSLLEKKLTDAVFIAIAESEVRDLEAIDKASQGFPDKYLKDPDGNFVIDGRGRLVIEEYGLRPDWKASAWRLERKFPERWGKKIKAEFSVEDSIIEVVFVNPEE